MDSTAIQRDAYLPSTKELKTPADGAEVPSFLGTHDLEALKTFYRREGFAIIRGLVPQEVCQAAIEAFERDVKPSRAYFKRHEWGRFQKHTFTEHGFMQYPIMNFQDLSPRFATFKRLGLDVLAHARVQEVMKALFNEPGRIIHTMFFDGNQRTTAHRDSHFIDAEKLGEMIGVWVAAEDIHEGAGRFYVCPGSHHIETPVDLNLDAMDPNTEGYKESMGRFVRGGGAAFIAPALKQGDVLLWSSLVIHGSLETTDPRHSRKSFTAHYVPASQGYLVKRRTIGSTAFDEHNGIKVTRHENQGSFENQFRAAVIATLGRFPKVLETIRKVNQKIRNR